MSTNTTMTKASKDDLFSTKETAKILDVNEKTLRRWNKERIFEPYLIDHHGDFFYTREQIEQLQSVYHKGRNKTYSNVRTMSAGQNVKDYSIENLRDQLKAIPYAVLANYGILHPAKTKGYVCPFCGNGTGETGTGIEEHIENGVVTSHCFKCPEGEKIDNIKILAAYYGLDDKDKTGFLEIVTRGAKDLLNIDFEPDTDNSALAELIRKDIAESQNNLPAFVEGYGGKWRGLTFDTLNHFGCGFLDKWTHPKNRISNKNLFFSRRFIIPTGKQNYNAILLNEDRNSKQLKSYNAGKKKLFGLNLLPKDIELLIIVEGEIDAMSIWQATDGKVFVAASGGVAFKQEFITDLAKFFGNRKPRILILFDNDTTGKENAPKLRDKFIAYYFPAVFKFLADGENKVDANDILQNNGNQSLADTIHKIIFDAKDDFEKVEKQIEEYTTQPEFDCDIKLTDDLRRKIYFVGNTDSDNGRRLTALFSNKVKYLADRDKWAFYESGIWNIQASGKNNLALTFADKAADIISANAKNDIEKKRAEPFKKHKYANPAISYFKVSDTVKITSKDLDKNQMLLPVSNGVIDLTTGELLDFDPKFLLTKKCPVEFKGLNYRSSLFDDFMQSILPDEQTRRAVLRFLGYSLTGDVSEEKALFILGNGRNGKGTLMNIMLTLLDDYSTSFRIETLLQQKFKDGNSATPEFAKLDGCRLAYANEIPPNERLDVSKFKDLTGGDKFSARKLHSEPQLIKPTHKFILCGQHLPEILDANDIGYLARLLVVKFTQQFTGENCDPKLKQKLLAPDVLSGVLSVLISECLEWQKHGLIISDAMTAEKNEYRDSNNFIADFINEFCVVKENARCKRTDLLQTLTLNYSADTKGLSQKALLDMILNAEPKVTRKTTNQGVMLFGIGLLDERQKELNFNIQNHTSPPSPSTDDDENLPF